MEARLNTELPPTLRGAPSSQGSLVTHYPFSANPNHTPPVDTSTYERILSEWFGCDVILLSSGKTGLYLYLNAKGFHRYRHRLQMPHYLARALINSVTQHVFPVHLPEDGDALLFYHQYGFTQRGRPKHDVVIEDIAHSFFASPHTGSRTWQGEVAVFSVTKFIPIAGMAGGLLVHNPAIAQSIRETIANAPSATPEIRSWMRNILANAYRPTSNPNDLAFTNSAYELLYRYFTADSLDLVGFPQSTDELSSIGLKRSERVNMYRAIVGRKSGQPQFWGDEEELLPFALPYFGTGNLDELRKVDRALSEMGIAAGIYHMDVNRDMYSPEYRPCVLIPCHQGIPIHQFEMICQAVVNHGH